MNEDNKKFHVIGNYLIKETVGRNGRKGTAEREIALGNKQRKEKRWERQKKQWEE